jgi:hypothetical protein
MIDPNILVQQSTTTGTCHPQWGAIRLDVEKIFLENSAAYKLAVDAVIAHQFGRHERCLTNLQRLGVENADSLRAICKRYGIELPSDKAA